MRSPSAVNPQGLPAEEPRPHPVVSTPPRGAVRVRDHLHRCGSGREGSDSSFHSCLILLLERWPHHVTPGRAALPPLCGLLIRTRGDWLLRRDSGLTVGQWVPESPEERGKLKSGRCGQAGSEESPNDGFPAEPPMATCRWAWQLVERGAGGTWV